MKNFGILFCLLLSSGTFAGEASQYFNKNVVRLNKHELLISVLSNSSDYANTITQSAIDDAASELKEYCSSFGGRIDRTSINTITAHYRYDVACVGDCVHGVISASAICHL